MSDWYPVPPDLVNPNWYDYIDCDYPGYKGPDPDYYPEDIYGPWPKGRKIDEDDDDYMFDE